MNETTAIVYFASNPGNYDSMTGFTVDFNDTEYYSSELFVCLYITLLSNDTLGVSFLLTDERNELREHSFSRRFHPTNVETYIDYFFNKFRKIGLFCLHYQLVTKIGMRTNKAIANIFGFHT